MPVLSHYCKAYPIASLQGFSGWVEQAAPEKGAEYPAVVFLHPDFRVTRGVYTDEGVLFDAVDDSWRQFCRAELGFEPPAADGEPGDA